MTLKEVFKEFILSRELAGLSEKTLIAYNQFVKPFVNDFSSGKEYETLTKEEINAYLLRIVRRVTIAQATKATYIRHIKIFLCWAQKTYGGNYNAKEIKVPRTPKKAVHIYSENEIEEIFESVVVESDWMTFRNKAIIALMLDSGLRQGEICKLERKNLTMASSRILIHGKGNKDRIVTIGKMSKMLLLRYLENCPYKGEYLFLNRYGKQMTNNSVKLFIGKLAQELPFEFSSHKLRHNFATNYCIDQYEKFGRIDIYRLAYIMGHEDVETTKRYLHMANEILASKESISHLDMVFRMEN